MTPEQEPSTKPERAAAGADQASLAAEWQRLDEENKDLKAQVARAEEAIRTLRRVLHLTWAALREQGLFAEEPAVQDWGKTPPPPFHEAGMLLEKVRLLLPDED